MELKVEENVSLAPLTTLGVGGVARYFYTLSDIAELESVVDFVESVKLPIFVLGGGSNVLIADGEINRFVLKNQLTGITFNSADEKGYVLVTAAAGENWDNFVEKVVEKGLSGLENLSGIPGTVGAAPIQNINAYGATVAEAIESVTVFDTATKQIQTLSAKDCLFGYRDSIFKHPEGNNFIVTAVTFRLSSSQETKLSYRSSSQSIQRHLEESSITEPTVVDVRQAVLQARKNIGMLAGNFRSAGSFFKNTIVSEEEFARIELIVKDKFADTDKQFIPWHWSLQDGTVKISTAFLMECSPYNKTTYGQKRLRGVVGLSPKHSLSIVTESGATAADVQEFVEMILVSIKNIFGVTIETEVNFVGI